MGGLARTGGRNNFGRITSFKKGGGKYRRMVRFIDFWRRVPANAFIVRFENDSFRSATITLVLYQTGLLSYIISPEGYEVGDKIKFVGFRSNLLLDTSRSSSGNLNDVNNKINYALWGSALPMHNIPIGSQIFNIELYPYKGAQLCRAAGASAILLSRRNNFVTIKLRSGWKMVLSSSCYATVGVASNSKHMYKVLGKAGKIRNLGRRPTVRGVAMNAIDHPHGGGRGKTSGGPRPMTPWGKITKQRRTVTSKKRHKLLNIRYR